MAGRYPNPHQQHPPVQQQAPYQSNAAPNQQQQSAAPSAYPYPANPPMYSAPPMRQPYPAQQAPPQQPNQQQRLPPPPAQLQQQQYQQYPHQQQQQQPLSQQSYPYQQQQQQQRPQHPPAPPAYSTSSSSPQYPPSQLPAPAQQPPPASNDPPHPPNTTTTAAGVNNNVSANGTAPRSSGVPSHAPIYNLPSKWSGSSPSLTTPPPPSSTSTSTVPPSATSRPQLRPTPPSSRYPVPNTNALDASVAAAANGFGRMNIGAGGGAPPPPSQHPQHQHQQHQPGPPHPGMGLRPVVSTGAIGNNTGLRPGAMVGPGGYAQGPAAPSAPMSAAAGPPEGMCAVSIGDAATLPRPDLTGGALAARVVGGDAPSLPPTWLQNQPAACPPEAFVPCSSRVIRMCNSSFPKSKALALKYGLPFGAVVQPLATPGPDEQPVPVVNFGTTGVVRCKRCRAYINFASSFRDGGRRWICSLCSYSNETPSDYFSPLDQNGKRRDAAERPELHSGTVEFVAPAEYMVRPPMPPVYLFLLETTPAAINSGMLAAAIAGIKNSIDAMPNEGRTRVGIMTFDSAVQFYSLHPGDTQPNVYIVSDIDDIFLPTPTQVLVPLEECRVCFERALDLIASTYSASNGLVSSSSCFGAALQGAQKAMEFVGGKIVSAISSRPTSGPGKLRDRGDNSNLNTDKERSVLRPETTFYRDMAINFSKYQISCDLFICPPPPAHFLDIAAIAQAAKYTGGEIFYSPNFEAPKDGPRLQLAVNRVLARDNGLEAVMRIRATKRVRCSRFSGRFFSRATDLLAMPNVDSDKAYAVQFSFEEALLDEGPFVMQVALLYTNTSGERRIRVHTVAVPLAENPGDLLYSADAAAIANVLTRQVAEGMKDRDLEEMRKNTNEKLTTALGLYRDACQRQYPPVTGGSELLMPRSLLLLPLFLHGLSKTPILSRDASGACLFRFDDKSALAHAVDAMNVAETSALLYPNVMAVYPWPVAAENNQPVKHPNGLPAIGAAALPREGATLIDDGRRISLWIGEAVAQKLTSELLGTTVTEAVDPRYLAVELMRRGASAKGTVGQVFGAVKNVLAARGGSSPVVVVPQGDRSQQPRLESLMAEDRSASRMSYREFLLEVQRTIAHARKK